MAQITKRTTVSGESRYDGGPESEARRHPQLQAS